MTEYAAVVTLLKFRCHNCGTEVVIDPNNPTDAETVANWLKVQSADGKTFAFDTPRCLREGALYFKKHPLGLAPSSDGLYAPAPDSGIVLTDPDTDDLVGGGE